MRKSYATDLSDSEWNYLRNRLPELPKKVRTRTHSLRDIFDAIFYVLKTGCHWGLLPRRNRRLSKDYERRVQTSECLPKVAMIRLVLRRLAREA